VNRSTSTTQKFRAAYLAEAIECMHGGEFAVGKRMLRNYINGTVGFEELSKAVGSPAKSLMRMLSDTSNPHADKLFGILSHLQAKDRLKVQMVTMTRPRRRPDRSRIA
jgi:hypothetical protein